MKFSVNDFPSKYDEIRRKLRIWSHLLEKSLIESFIFCAVSRFAMPTFHPTWHIINTFKIRCYLILSWPSYKYLKNFKKYYQKLLLLNLALFLGNCFACILYLRIVEILFAPLLYLLHQASRVFQITLREFGNPPGGGGNRKLCWGGFFLSAVGNLRRSELDHMNLLQS